MFAAADVFDEWALSCRYDGQSADEAAKTPPTPRPATSMTASRTTRPRRVWMLLLAISDPRICGARTADPSRSPRAERATQAQVARHPRRDASSCAASSRYFVPDPEE